MSSQYGQPRLSNPFDLPLLPHRAPVPPPRPPPHPYGPPPPQPPHLRPSASSSSSSRRWPLSSRTGPLSFYFDPHSSKAAILRREVESRLTARGDYLPVASTVAEATHIVLDSDCAANQWLRRGHRDDQHVVTLKWLEDSFVDSTSADEGLYKVNPRVAGEQVGDGTGARVVSSGKAADRVGDGRQGSSGSGRPPPQQPNTSGSDEEMDMRLKENRKKVGRPTGKTNKPGWVRWTDNERQTLAGLIAKSATLQQAYADFSRQFPNRGSSAALGQHSTYRTFYDAAVQRIKAGLPWKDDGANDGRDAASSSGSDMDIDDSSTQPHPLTKSNKPSHQPPPPQFLEPEAFRLPGVPPSNLPSPSSDWCWFCGVATSSRFGLIHTLAGSREVDGETVVQAAVPRKGCAGSLGFEYQGRIGGSSWTKEMPKGLGELERRAFVTEKLLVRGMKKRRERVEG